MADYYSRIYRALSADMKSGPGIGHCHVCADTDAAAISLVREKWAADFNPGSDTIYLWQGNRLVWGDGVEAEAEEQRRHQSPPP